MTKKQYSLMECATLVGVKAYRIIYAINNRFLSEPARIMNFRMFTEADVAAAKKYFSNKKQLGRPIKKEANE